MLSYNVQHTYKAGAFIPEQTKIPTDPKKDLPTYLSNLQLKDSKGKQLTLGFKDESGFEELLR